MLALTLLGGIVLASGYQIGVTVDNINAGDSVDYPMVILRGHTEEHGVRAGLDGAKLLYYPAFQGRYVALCELKPGQNFVTVKAGADKVRMRLDYKPSTTPYRIRAAWSTTRSIDPSEIRRRVDLNLKLLQGFVAESMWEAGFGRRTFQLDSNRDGKLNLAIESGAGPKAFGPGFDESVQRGLVFTDGPRPQSDANTVAVTAAAPVGDWPESIGQVAKAFANRQTSGPLTGMDDLGRGTVWAGYSSTLGDTLRRIGALLGLPQTKDPQSLMGTGYTRINRAFLAYEAPSKGQPDETPVYPSSVPKWTADDAKRLSESPWIAP